ncbi:hypothetical protein ACFQNE_05045 [Gordonia phosphorivorans]|uniref:Uncharacterized protein n=1 Tax=Gordonia phosphorivorans TaxID=1056982 RepID=A0ABV6H5G2_9ACTN
MPETSDNLADALLDAQVAFTLSQLTDADEYAALVDTEIAAFMVESGSLPLETAMPRELIKAVARKYTMQFPVEGAIPELVGQVAARLYHHEVHRTTVLSEVIDTRRFDELASVATELPVAKRAVDQVLASPTTVDTVVEVVQRTVERRVGVTAGRRLAGLVDRWTRRGTTAVLTSVREDSDDLLREALHEFWRGRASEEVDGFRDTVGEADVEDVVVLVFEFWRTFRQTEFFRTLLDAGIDEVFDTYGATPIADVLADLGVSETDLREEALRFGPPVITRLDTNGFLAQLVRRRLAPFYASAQFRAALARRSE